MNAVDLGANSIETNTSSTAVLMSGAVSAGQRYRIASSSLTDVAINRLGGYGACARWATHLMEPSAVIINRGGWGVVVDIKRIGAERLVGADVH